MAMTRAILFLVSFFAFLAVSFGAPIAEASEVDKRIVHHKGRVSTCLHLLYLVVLTTPSAHLVHPGSG